MLRTFLFCSALAVAACGASEAASTTASPEGGATSQQSTPADANGCCPRDTTQSGCMNLGGYSASGSCFRSCDFWCSSNWRVEKDTHGCEAWRYDVRAPKGDEDSTCIDRTKPQDAGVDSADGSDGGDGGDY